LYIDCNIQFASVITLFTMFSPNSNECDMKEIMSDITQCLKNKKKKKHSNLYMGIHYLESDIVSVMEIQDMKEHMKIIEKMTQKYSVSFHLIVGNYVQVASYEPFMLKMLPKQKGRKWVKDGLGWNSVSNEEYKEIDRKKIHDQVFHSRSISLYSSSLSD
jgi:hypothetical protein